MFTFLDRNYIPLIEKPIEDEFYYKKVDRWSAEEILRNRIDGSCLVRPYKEEVCKDFILSFSKISCKKNNVKFSILIR